MQNLIPQEIPKVSWNQIRILLGIGIGILICVIVFRRLLHIVIIDMCILGDYSACPCARRNRNQRRRNQQEGDSSSNNGNVNHTTLSDRSWNSRDAIALVNLGAFANPYKYLYHNLSDEKRKKILDIIRNKKILNECNLDLEQHLTKKCTMDTESEHETDGDIHCSICLQPVAWMDRSLSCPVCRKHLLSRDELLIILADHRSMLRRE